MGRRTEWEEGRSGKDKELTDCVQSYIRAFGIAGDWEATALEAEVWVETVVGGSWPRGGKKRQTRLDIARRRERQRDWEICYRTRKRNFFAKRQPLLV